MFNTTLYEAPLPHSSFCQTFWPRTYSHPYSIGFIHHPLIIHSPIRALRFTVLIHLKIQSIRVSAPHSPSSTSNTTSDGNNLKVENMRKQHLALSITFLTYQQTLLSITLELPSPCSHPLHIVVSTILESDFLHPLHPTVAPFYFAISHLHSPSTPGCRYCRLDNTRLHPSLRSLCMLHYPVLCPSFVYPQISSSQRYPLPRMRNRGAAK